MPLDNQLGLLENDIPVLLSELKIIQILQGMDFKVSANTYGEKYSYYPENLHSTSEAPPNVEDYPLLYHIYKLSLSFPTRLKEGISMYEIAHQDELEHDPNWEEPENYDEDPLEVAPFPEMPTEIPVCIMGLTHLIELYTSDLPIKNIPDLPSSIESMTLGGCNFQSLHDVNAPWDNIQLLRLKNCHNLLSLEGFPHSMPNLVNFYLEDCGVQSLEGGPNGPNLKNFHIEKCPIRNYAGQEKILANSPLLKPFSLSQNISSYGCQYPLSHYDFWRYNQRIIKRLYLNNSIPVSYQEIFNRNNWTYSVIKANLRLPPKDQKKIYLDIYELFKTDPTTLATRYANTPSSITKFEKERICHEGTLITLKTLYQLVSFDDPILVRLASRWKLPLNSDKILL
jgi:hypothetical protein